MDKQNESIAYLGMGIMGASMAVNLCQSGYSVSVWNRTSGRAGVQRAVEAGAQLASTVTEAVKSASIVMLCLTDVADLEDVLLRPDGVAAALKPGAIVVDFSTTGPECARKMSAILAEKSVHFLDAPVSGGDVGARNGTLTVMVGGDRSSFDRCVPVFQSVGKNIHYCGGSGSGQSVKLCNQILCAVNMLAVCESLKLADVLSIDPALMIEVCGSGAAGSWALSNLGPRIAKGDLEPGFMIKDMRKDLRLVQEALRSTNVQLDASKLADGKFEKVSEELTAKNTDGERKGTQAMCLAYGLNS